MKRYIIRLLDVLAGCPQRPVLASLNAPNQLHWGMSWPSSKDNASNPLAGQ